MKFLKRFFYRFIAWLVGERHKIPQVPQTPVQTQPVRNSEDIKRELEFVGICGCGLPYDAYWRAGARPPSYKGNKDDKKAFQEYLDNQLLMCRGGKNNPCKNIMIAGAYRKARELISEYMVAKQEELAKMKLNNP